MMRFARTLWIAVGVLVALPATAFTLVKPLRVVVPALVPGVECPSAHICTDDVALLAEAQTLYRAGYERAAAMGGPFHHPPRVVFCATRQCAQKFGVGRAAGKTVGDFGLVMAPRGWKPFYLAHELIHHRQAESLGNFAMITKPKWLIEGMAYSLSDDPRRPLGQPFEKWRTQFDAWHARVGSRDLWEAAGEVHMSDSKQPDDD